MNYDFFKSEEKKKTVKNFYGNRVSGVVEALFPALFWRKSVGLLFLGRQPLLWVVLECEGTRAALVVPWSCEQLSSAWRQGVRPRLSLIP